MQYNTPITSTPPVTPGIRESAVRGILAPQVGRDQRFQDIYSGRAASSATDYDREANMANDKFLLQAQPAQVQSTLTGLQQMATQEQNDRDVATRRYGIGMGLASSAMGGINNLLQGLFN